MSHDVLAEEIFVAEDQPPVDNRPEPHEPWLPEGPRALRVPPRARAWMSGMMLGIAQVALKETIEFAKGSEMSLGGGGRTSMPGNQFAVADAAMAVESARAFLYQETRAIAAKADAGERFCPEDVSRIEMAGLVARENAQRAVDRLFSIRGAHGLFETGNFERYYRDVRMSTLHAVSTPDLVREQVLAHLFGVPSDSVPRWGCPPIAGPLNTKSVILRDYAFLVWSTARDLRQSAVAGRPTFTTSLGSNLLPGSQPAADQKL